MPKYIIIDDRKTMRQKPFPSKKGDAMGDNLVRLDYKIPKNASVFLKVPYVPNGFENSCSECSAEMIVRYWGIENWSQFEMHQFGYQTFEGSIAEGDVGLLNFLVAEDFTNKKGELIKFQVELIENGTLNDLRKYLDLKIPLIIRYDTNDRGDKHTIVFIGYDKNGFYKHDNDLGSSLYMTNDFMKKHWKNQYLLIYPRNYL